MSATKFAGEQANYNSLEDDVVGDDDSEDEYDSKATNKKSQKNDKSGKDEEPEYMQFDFRKGIKSWPENVELIDPKAAELLVEEATKALEEAAKLNKADKEKDGEKTTTSTTSTSHSYNQSSNTSYGNTNTTNTYKIPDYAVFEPAAIGSPTALIIEPGYRLKFDLTNLLDGGDAMNKKRKKKNDIKNKKNNSSSSSTNYNVSFPSVGEGFNSDDMIDIWDDAAFANSYNFKNKAFINEYTITMDIKLLKEPPREGLSLFQTALIHCDENKRTGKTTLTKSDGECIINQAGGIGMFGTYGDTTKAKLEIGKWKRVVITIKCGKSSTEKGEMRTWVGTNAGVVLREETITANERFALSSDQFYLFSSGQSAMMPGSIALRYIRIEKHFSTDADVKSNRARDKVISVFNEDRELEVAEQQKGLSLAAVFAKPRPMWTAPAFVGAFGDNFIERTNLEGSSVLAWSFTVINHALQEMAKNQNPLLNTGLDHNARVGVSDTLHIMQRSAVVFKHMTKLFKSPNDSNLLSMLRKLRKLLSEITVGESILLPALVENRELIMLLERTSERLFTVVIIQTDALSGLKNHSATASGFAPEIRYRVCLVLKDIPKKNALDDVFWTAVYNLSIHTHDGDMHKFYDILIPFLTGKPLEISLVEAETAACKFQSYMGSNDDVLSMDLSSNNGLNIIDNNSDNTDSLNVGNSNNNTNTNTTKSTTTKTTTNINSESVLFKNCGDWRPPQRSHTSYVRCIFEAMHYMLRSRGLTALQSKQIHLTLSHQLVSMSLNDLAYMTPDENGQRVCKIALRELSHLAVSYVDEVKQIIPSITTSISTSNSNNISPNIIEKETESESENIPNVALILTEIQNLVQLTTDALTFCQSEETEGPPLLELPSYGEVPHLKGIDDPASVQYMDMLLWDVELNDPDPGQAVNLRKYIPVDLLQIPQRASTRNEAIRALRMCDRLCTLMDNQAHCIKNDKFIIVAAIEHVLTQVVPVPKPRGVRVTDTDAHRSERCARRAEKKKLEEEETKRKKEEKRIKDEKEGKFIPQKASKRRDKEKEKEKKKLESDETNIAPPQVKCFGEEILPDFEVGKEAERMFTSRECIWDEDVTYELQVELMITLQRLMEHFVSAALSIQQSRSFDGVCIVVPGCITAIADAIMRKFATNEPSEACSHLMGRTVAGRQLGHPGFGISISSFATQCETIEVHSAELNIARTAVLDYFQSPEQRRLHKIFHWEDNYQLLPGENLVKYLRNICREIGIADGQSFAFIADNMGIKYTALVRYYPELKCYRDICFWWKHFLNTDRTEFSNYSDPDDPRDVPRIMRVNAKLEFNWDGDKGWFIVKSFRKELTCRPKEVKGKPMPLHRFPSTATPSFYLPLPAIKTEDDVIYRPNLPNFANAYGQVLNQRDSELLLSYLTVPYMRLPLLLTFFSSDDRIHKLQSPELRMILDSVLFEPGKYLAINMEGVEPVMVPTRHPELLATPYGLLINELYRSPDTIIRCVLNLIKGALAVDTGSVVDEGAINFNVSSTIIMYICRLASRVDNYMSFLIDWRMGIHDCIDFPLRDIEVTDDVLARLVLGRSELRELLFEKFDPLFEDYLRRLDLQTTKDPTNEKLIDRNSRLACDLHSHKLIMYRNLHIDDLSPKAAKAVIGSFVYLTTRHTWNKATTKEGSRLQMPETELYELLQVLRRRLIKWTGSARQTCLDEVMQTVLQVSSSLTGSFKTKAEMLDSQNRWSRIQGERSVGRWAVGFTRTVVMSSTSSSNLTTMGSTDTGSTKAVVAIVPAPAVPKPTLTRQQSSDATVGEISDTGQLGVEIDVQMGQMTLRSKHLAALPSNVANHPDVKLIFGEATIQASLLEKGENRSRYRLVGLNHELEYWNGHKNCPILGDEWEREYDPGDLFPTEKWIVNLFEPVRKSFFDGPDPKAMQFMMPENALPEDAEVAVLLGLHQNIGGPWKLVYLFRRLRCIHIYECVSQGRQWWYSLHMTTDVRYTLRDMQPDVRNRKKQHPNWWINGSGGPYPTGVQETLMNHVDGTGSEPQSSVLVIREAQHILNLSGGKEVLVPSRLLYGVLPAALLDAYRFWQDESIYPRGTNVSEMQMACRGYKRLLGYPVDNDGEYLIIVEMQYIAPLGHVYASNSSTITKKGDAFIIQCTGLPGRTIRVTRRPRRLYEADFQQRQRIANLLESLRLLAPPEKKKKSETEKETDDNDMLFKVDTEVECDYEGKGEYWPCVVRRVNDNGTYDLEYVGDYKWVGVQRGTDPDIVQRRGDAKKKADGEGIFHWAGMTDSEDDDWREDSEEEKDEEDIDSKQKERLAFFHFDELSMVMDAANGDEALCERALRRLASVPGPMPFSTVMKLARAVQELVEGPMSSVKEDDSTKTSPSNIEQQQRMDSEDMYLLNLLYAPRRSRLCSVMKTLSRIENVSYMCAWTSAKNSDVTKSSVAKGISFGCPPIDLVELPRLKLAFVAKYDHQGKYRLYSMDHVDLFITNDRNPLTSKMLSGIPHSILLSNIRGETQVLVPVIPPIRPVIQSDPFSTYIVLNRTELPPSERFFLYPVHVSLSFLLTKGINSAVYLMVLRFLHRDYEDVFRLSDSIATDTSFNEEGLSIFKCFISCTNDWHPDAHSCRLKISLVTMDSGMKAPWDLTIECSRHVLKLASVSSSCRISPEEELQLLESDAVATSEDSTAYNKEIHDAYSMALCFNRQQQLRSYSQIKRMEVTGQSLSNNCTICSEGLKVACRVPPRNLSSNWPYYTDNTVFGEDYAQMLEVTAEDGESSWKLKSRGWEELAVESPPGGWLVIACFHVLWSSGSVKVMPLVTDIVPLYQNFATFISVRADCIGLDNIAKSFDVKKFPTFIILRGGKEVDRVEGSDRVVEKLVRILSESVTDADKLSHEKRRHWLREEKIRLLGRAEEEEPEVEKGNMEWTWDGEQCGDSMRIVMQGLCVVLKDDSFADYEYPPTWEYNNSGNKWVDLDKATSAAVEAAYRTGECFRGQQAEISTGQISSIQASNVEITSYEVSGFTGELNDWGEVQLRRRGQRVFVPDEENFVSKEQQERDRQLKEWRDKADMRKQKLKQEKIGKDVESMRGSISLLPNTGVHTWKMTWNHEPARGGQCDSFGLMSEASEFFGPCPAPCVGGKADGGASIALHATGNMYHNGICITTIQKERKNIPVIPTVIPKGSSDNGDAANETATSVGGDNNGTAESKSDVVSIEHKQGSTDTSDDPNAVCSIVDECPLPAIEYAPLFGKGSVVSCTLDTSLDGGTLNFFLDDDGVVLFTMTGVYEKLGGTELFPCVSMCPLDPINETEARAERLKKLKEIKESETPQYNGMDLSKVSEEQLPDIVKDMIFFESHPSVSIISDEDLKEKEEAEKEKLLQEEALKQAAEKKDIEDSNNDSNNIEGKDNKEKEKIKVKDSSDEEDQDNKPETKKIVELNVSVERVRWMWQSKKGWQVYSKEISKSLETAQRDSKSSYILTIGEATVTCNLDTMKQIDDDGEEQSLRRHIVGEGLAGMWEMLTMRYEPVLGMYGAGFLTTLEKVWSSNETIDGKECGLGFLALYALLSGELRCKAIPGGFGGYGGYGGGGGKSGGYGGGDMQVSVGGYGGGGGGRSSSADSFRLAVLMAQLMVDGKTKSLPASVINVLCRNRQVSLRMPKFKDNRKTKNAPFFQGWIDENEARSPIADLFSKLVPLMTSMKRKGAFHFPPPPPHPELPAPASSYVMCTRLSTGPGGGSDAANKIKSNDMFKSIEWIRPVLSDFSCDTRVLEHIRPWSVESLAASVQYRFGADALRPQPPKNIEYSEEFDKLFRDAPDRLIIADFTADWCGPSRAVAPIFRFLSLNTPTATFVRVDIDQVEDLAARFEVESVPYVCFIRGGATKDKVLGSVKGFGPKFLSEFSTLIYTHSTEAERAIQVQFRDNCPGENISVVLDNMCSTPQDVDTLSALPLADVCKYVTRHTRKELNMKEVDPQLAFDISHHESAGTTVAQSILLRIKDDVKAYASVANTDSIPKILHLADTDIYDYFHSIKSGEVALNNALQGVVQLQQDLIKLRDEDAKMVQETVPLLQKASNWVEFKDIRSPAEMISKTRFLLLRTAGLNASVWTEFLFGALLSSKCTDDLLSLNPFLDKDTINVMMNLCITSMLRANRVGHANRCIGAVIDLERLLKKILNIPLNRRQEEAPSMIPKLIQAGEDLARNITMVRYYIRKDSQGLCEFDPRYLVFEFVWNLQLRQKQVEIVHNFRNSLKHGTSKVKQMIMGAGKTSVVAPLLALILADGKSLVLSVVPKALVEMSRSRMRETFAVIMVKRIYTLDFDRSTTVRPAMRRSLENAARNRGVVVATPTTIKSVMLAYIEVLRQIREAYSTGIKSNLDALKLQAEELSKILKLFDEGVMLLDEVDLILHPLKSELNFPIGDKFDLDGSENGERWSLPIHLIDAIFYASTARISTFEKRGEAFKILENISQAVKKGVEERHLQRLPHVTLLNIDFYNEILKPLMADWTFLWLQKQHLHGITQSEALQYMLEGAAAQSDTKTKLKVIMSAIGAMTDKIEGNEPRSHTPLTFSPKKRRLSRERSDSPTPNNPNLSTYELDQLKIQLRHLKDARDVAEEHFTLVYEIHNTDEELSKQAKEDEHKIDELQMSIKLLNKKISEMECPRDDSFDNSIIVWLSNAFSAHSQLTGNTSNSTMTSGAAGNAVSTPTTSETSVSVLCNRVEDLGMTIRRCGEAEEAVSKARDLQLEGHLRCVVLGGSEKGNDDSSDDGDKIDFLKIVNTLTEKASAYARKHGPLDPSRIAIYSSQSSLREEDQMNLWTLGVTVTDDPARFISWAVGLQNNNNKTAEDGEGEETEIDADEKTRIDPDVHQALLVEARAELENLEDQKAKAIEKEESNKRSFQSLLAEKNSLLVESAERRIEELNDVEKQLSNILRKFDDKFDENISSMKNSSSRSYSARDAAMACAWLEMNGDKEDTVLSSLLLHKNDKPVIGALSIIIDNKNDFHSNIDTIYKFIGSVQCEITSLRKMTLATKVIAHITSPIQKKLLNLCHHWLTTFLPHCLAKVNRVSFGLLSEADCKTALENDPNVPRSRLKLAVPFVGKDVPSQSSEFAHPDVIIGLTVMAYRYSGLRKEDFLDLIDGLTLQYSHEIGPPRERESNIRHEGWVYASGGKIRGLKCTKDGQKWTTDPNDETGSKEVVQLKFLQKSNEEQMDKLYDLFKLEPLVLHYYLQKSIFPIHMRSQCQKISASGQAVGGDMLVSKRVGFSGTPSDLLPKELGRCDYETGDDGMMLTTVLNRSVASHEFLQDGWTVEGLLERIATSESPRFNALIDTGALITGFSNREVARKLLDLGLVWCEGVVFLDDDDKQQVLVRATDRVVSADQCGVTLERRFAFYDQIHTTGMDIKHVVNATAVITLGKDMVFRDYVQGAYRMRGIGIGQKIHVFIIPEVAQLIRRELRTAVINRGKGNNEHVLEDIVAWLIINSLKSEQTQWIMLCLQNITNLYRKNAFRCLRKYIKYFINGLQDELLLGDDTSSGNGDNGNGEVDNINENSTSLKIIINKMKTFEKDKERQNEFINTLDKTKALELFDESIDFSLDAGVPDARPFDVKLKDLLQQYEAFLQEEQIDIGESIICEVGHFASMESSANRLDTEQEREQEQEQEKEVEARKDKQIEVEKFVEREYSRQEEVQRPWPFYLLSKDRSTMAAEDHPFYPLKDFKLRYQESLGFPSNMYLSTNFFNPNWNGLRRVKNVVMVMEYAPSITGNNLRLLSMEETRRTISDEQEIALSKAHSQLGFHANQSNMPQHLSRKDVSNAIQAITDEHPTAELLDFIFEKFSKDKMYLTLAQFRSLVTCGLLQPRSGGRYWVGLSLAEAETIRRILHVRKNSHELIPGATTAVALRYSLFSGNNSPLAGDGGVVLDVSKNWMDRNSSTRTNTSSSSSSCMTAPKYEASMVHSAFRFFDCDMHFAPSALNILIRELQGSTRDREIFFQSVIGCRRRMDIKWQETPLARLFYTANEWMALKQRAQAIFIKEALAAKNLTRWEAFTAFDYDNSGFLSPSECYGALLWIGIPGLTAEDVADFIDAADINRDGQMDYKEYIDMLMIDDDDDEEDTLQNDENETDSSETEIVVIKKLRVMDKVDPHGAEELREVMVKRKQAEQIRNKLERQRRQKYQEDLDLKVFEEELETCKKRKGGANPLVTTVDYIQNNNDSNNNTSDKDNDNNENNKVNITDFSFIYNQTPLRCILSGKSSFLPIYHNTSFSPQLHLIKCKKNHSLRTAKWYETYWDRCEMCRAPRPGYYCQKCNWGCCAECYETDRRLKESDIQNPAKNPTFMRCSGTCSFSLQIPTKGGSNPISGCYTISMELRIEKLPPYGQLQSLLRLTLPDQMKSAKKLQASLYIDCNGNLTTLESSIALSSNSIKLSNKEIIERSQSISSKSTSTPNKSKVDNNNDDGYPNIVSVTTHEHTLHRSYVDDGWSCSGITCEDGCKSGITGFRQTSGWRRWRCSNCDYDFCEKCLKAYSVDPIIITTTTTTTKKQTTSPKSSKTQIKSNINGHSTSDKTAKTDDPSTPDTDTDKDINKDKVLLRGGIWQLISIAIDPDAGKLVTFINGRLCSVCEGLDPSDLRLQHKMVILGGGKAAQCRGGDIRRITIHSTAIDESQARNLYYTLVYDSPAIGGRVLRIQTIYRGFAVRLIQKRLKEKLEKDEDEDESDFTDGTKVEFQHEGASEYYPGVIKCKTESGNYDIDYDDGKTESNIEKKFIRRIKKSTRNVADEKEEDEEE